MPNGDVMVAEALLEPGPVRSAFDYAMAVTMRRAAALGTSPNRITRLRDADGDGVAEVRGVFRDGLRQPFGMALVGDSFYVGNTDGILAFAYAGGERLEGEGRKLVDFEPGGHWTRSLLAAPDGTRLYAGVGSLTNIAEQGFEVEEGRAAVWEVDLASGRARMFAGGLRNPVGLAWEPVTGALWTVVNERDGLGDETPPDYLTEVVEGGFYGWPYCYWGRRWTSGCRRTRRWSRRRGRRTMRSAGIPPRSGCAGCRRGRCPGYGDGMVIGQHGSWNRSTLSGYRVIHVPFADGRPSGPPRTSSAGSCRRTRRRPTGGRSGWRSGRTGRCWWRTTWGTWCGG